MVTVEDTKTGNTFEVTDYHWEANLARVSRYKKAEKKEPKFETKKPVGRPKKVTQETQEEIED